MDFPSGRYPANAWTIRRGDDVATIRSLIFLPVLALPAMADQPLPVQLVTAQRDSVVFETSLTGSLAARELIEVGFPQGGRVTQVLVSEGDIVRRGQELARTDPIQQDQLLAVAQASLAAAIAAQDQATQAADRAATMLDRGVGTRAAHDQARRALSAAQGAVRQAESDVALSRRAVEDTVMLAPADGVITARNAEPGQIVAAAQPVMSLAVSDEIEAVFYVPDLPGLGQMMGMEIKARPLDFEGPEMIATVTEISPLVDPQTGSIAVRATVHDAPRDVRLLGTAISGRLRLLGRTATMVPWTALSSVGDQPAVWVVDDQSRVELRPVEVTRFMGDKVLLEGIEPGQIVVGAGSQMLFPGRQVVEVSAIE